MLCSPLMAIRPTARSPACFVVICLIVFCILLGVFGAVMVSENPELAFYLLGKREKFEILKFLGVGMGGVLLTLQVWMSHKRAKAMESTASAQAKATEEQAKANRNTEQGQRQERLKNAIEHLGHQSDSVRLGGAYELFHLARDTEELRRTVLDILCAHIRRVTGEGPYRETHNAKPSEEIQSLLTLLFVQNHRVFKGLDVNLRESWLTGANLGGARLLGATLTETCLQSAFLRDARLQGAFLRDARLQGADLRNARLQGALLHSVRLQCAGMEEAGLQGASLGGAGLQSAKLNGADLRGAKVWRDYLTPEEQQRRGPVQDHQLFSRASVPTFAERIRESIDQETDTKLFFEVKFEGGLSDKDMDSLAEGFCDEDVELLRKDLAPHIDQPVKPLVPETSGVITGAYTKEEAETWIAEYEADV